MELGPEVRLQRMATKLSVLEETVRKLTSAQSHLEGRVIYLEAKLSGLLPPAIIKPVQVREPDPTLPDC